MLYKLQTKTTRWGKLESMKSAQSVAADPFMCLIGDCTGRLKRTTVEKEKGKAGGEVFFQAKWYTDQLAAEEEKRKLEAEESRRQAEERKAQAAAAAEAAASEEAAAHAANKKSRNQEKKADREKRRNHAINLKQNAPDAATVAEVVVPVDTATSLLGKKVRGRVPVGEGGVSVPRGAGASTSAEGTNKVDEQLVEKVMQLDADQMVQVGRKHGDDPFGGEPAAAPKGKSKEEKEREKRERQAAKRRGGKKGKVLAFGGTDGVPHLLSRVLALSLSSCLALPGRCDALCLSRLALRLRCVLYRTCGNSWG